LSRIHLKGGTNQDGGALTSLNLLANDIPVEQAHELVKIMQAKENLTTLCGLRRKETALDFRSQGLGPGDAVLIANDIKDRKGLTSLDISNNAIGCIIPPHGWETGKLRYTVDGVVAGRKLHLEGFGRQCFKPSGAAAEEWVFTPPPNTKPEGVVVLVNAIKDMEAMTSLDLSSNMLGAAGGDIVAEAIEVTTKCLIAMFLTPFSTVNFYHYPQDMKALSSLHVGQNNCRPLAMRKIMAVAMSKDSMRMLCAVPIKENTLTELDLSGRNLGVEGALVVAEYLHNNGAPSCEDGQYYHEWSLNLKYDEAGSSFICPNGHRMKEFQTSNTQSLFGTRLDVCDGGERCPAQGSRYPVGTTLYGCHTCDFHLCAQCVTTAKTEPKYVSTAPDVEGQDDDPGVPLSNGMCLHCNAPKGAHKAKGAMTKLSLKDNWLATAAAGEALGGALRGNTVLKELDVSR
jgi:hypothetical protein